MLALLEFLVSPVLLPSMEEATMKYLSKSCVVSMDRMPEKVTERRQVIRGLQKEFLPLIKDKKNAPLIGLLDGSIMNMFDNTFSEHMSAFMTLYGTTEDPEVKRYDAAFDAYHRLLTERAKEIIRKDMLVYYKNNPDGAREKATLLNIGTKMMWWKLCFDPSLGTSLSLKTRPPVLSVSVIAAIMLNWNACQMSKHVKVPRGEPRVKEVAFFAEPLGEASASKSSLAYAYANVPAGLYVDRTHVLLCSHQFQYPWHYKAMVLRWWRTRPILQG
jgi:hypothetical protein